MKIYVTAVEALMKKERQHEKLSVPPKLLEKLVWVPVILFCQIFIPSSVFDSLSCRNWPFLPPNCLTLGITLLCKHPKKESENQEIIPKALFPTSLRKKPYHLEEVHP